MKKKLAVIVALLLAVMCSQSIAGTLENLIPKPSEVLDCTRAETNRTGSIFNGWGEAHVSHKSVHVEANLGENSITMNVLEDSKNTGDASIWSEKSPLIPGHEYAYILTAKRAGGNNAMTVQTQDSSDRYVRNVVSKGMSADVETTYIIRFTPKEGDITSRLKMSLYGSAGHSTTYSDLMLVDLTDNPITDDVLVKLNYFSSTDFKGMKDTTGLDQATINAELLRQLNDLRAKVLELESLQQSNGTLNLNYDSMVISLLLIISKKFELNNI